MANTTHTQTVLYHDGSVFEMAVAILCKDAEASSDPEVVPPADTLVLFVDSIGERAFLDFLEKGFKTIRVISYAGEKETGENYMVFPPSGIFTWLELEPGVEVASFLDHVAAMTIPDYTPYIGDTTVARAKEIFKAISGLRLDYPAVCVGIVEGSVSTYELVEFGRVVERTQRASVFRTLQSGVELARDVPLFPGGEGLVHPDGAAAETFTAKILYVNYSPNLFAELDYTVNFLKDSPFDYLLSGVDVEKGVDGGDPQYILRAIRLNPAAPAGVCLLGGGEISGEISTRKMAAERGALSGIIPFF